MSTLDQLSKFSVKDILQMPVGDCIEVSNELTPELLSALEIDLVIYGIVEFNITRIDNGLDCEVAIKGVTNIVCSRCVNNINLRIAGTTQSYYMVKSLDSEYQISVKSTINLVQQVVDTVIQALPNFPLCQYECKGLCPTCGINLNINLTHFEQFTDHKHGNSLVNTARIK